MLWFKFTFSAKTAAMTCPFLSRLPSQFVKNYSSKLLKTYGEHCPVVSHVSRKKDTKISATITTLNDDFAGRQPDVGLPWTSVKGPSSVPGRRGSGRYIYPSKNSYVYTRVELNHAFNFLQSKIQDFDTGLSQGVSKCPMGGAALHTQSSGLSPVRQVRSNI